jgi:pimeloyl-[acyl-carrier protein] methyl ester esterase
MDGTGELLAAFVRHLPRELGPRIVAYPREGALGYAELMREIPLPEGPFAIVAESFSGPLGIRLAARHRQRVCGVVLVSTFVRCPAPLLARIGLLFAPLLFRQQAPAFALRWALMGSDATDAEVEEARTTLRSVSVQALAARLHEIVRVDVSEEFARSDVPTLYVAGNRDRFVRPRVVAQLRALRPDIDVCSLDAPHFVLQRRPAEAAEAISRYLLEKTFRKR